MNEIVHIGDAVLMNVDFREIVQTLKIGRPDLILTDPPYGEGYVPRKNENVNRSTLRNTEAELLGLKEIIKRKMDVLTSDLDQAFAGKAFHLTQSHDDPQ